MVYGLLFVVCGLLLLFINNSPIGPTSNHKPQTTNHKPQTTNHKPQTQLLTHFNLKYDSF